MISFRPQHPKASRKVQGFMDADNETMPVDFVPRLADAEHRVAGEDFISLKSVGIAKPLDSKPRRPRMKFIQLQTNQHKTSKKQYLYN
jgi:hypothetical protein